MGERLEGGRGSHRDGVYGLNRLHFTCEVFKESGGSELIVCVSDVCLIDGVAGFINGGFKVIHITEQL